MFLIKRYAGWLAEDRPECSVRRRARELVGWLAGWLAGRVPAGLMG
jgi:hypothetical protein